MPQEPEFFIEKANHCIRLARLIMDASIKSELQALARDFMAEADRLHAETESAPPSGPDSRERRYA